MDNKFRELSDKIYPNVSDKAKQAIDNINDAFDESQLMIDEMQRIANFAEGKPPKGMANQHLGITHGKEYVYRGVNSVKCSLMDKNLARLRRLLDGDITRSVDDDGTVNITINNQKP